MKSKHLSLGLKKLLVATPIIALALSGTVYACSKGHNELHTASYQTPHYHHKKKVITPTPAPAPPITPPIAPPVTPPVTPPIVTPPVVTPPAAPTTTPVKPAPVTPPTTAVVTPSQNQVPGFSGK